MFSGMLPNRTARVEEYLMPLAVWAQPLWHRPIRRFSWGWCGSRPPAKSQASRSCGIPPLRLRSGQALTSKSATLEWGTRRFRAVKTLGKTLYPYLRHARYLKHADLELRFRDHVCIVLDHWVGVRCRYSESL